MKKPNHAILIAQSKDCPYIYRALESMRHGVDAEDALTSAVLALSGSVRAQGEMITRIMMNMPSPPLRAKP